MEEIIKKLNNLDKGYSGKKRSISISLSEENIKLLEFIEKSTGLDRSKVMAFALQNSQSLLNTLLDQVKLARMLGFKSPNKMKRAIERATKRLEEKEKKKEYPIS